MNRSKHEAYFKYAKKLFDPKRIFDKPEALKGIRVIDFSQYIIGPQIPTLLGEAGAEVIKVEAIGKGDAYRYVNPAIKGYFKDSIGVTTVHLMRNKYSVAIDARTEQGQGLITRLAAKSDVFVENFRPGTVDSWNLSYKQLSQVNPRLIYVSCSGFGQYGPRAFSASYDLLSQAFCGLAGISGTPEAPLKNAAYISDYIGGYMGTIAVLAALRFRRKTEKGQYIDNTHARALARVLDWTWVYYHLTGEVRGRYANRDVAVVPSEIFRCKDGYIAVAAGVNEAFEGLCKAMGKPDLARDPRFTTPERRSKPEYAEFLSRIIGEWVAQKGIKELMDSGAENGFSATPVVNAKDIYEDEDLRLRGCIQKVDDPIYGEMVELAPLIISSKSPSRIKWAARPVGFDNEHIFHQLLGLTTGEIKALEKKGVIGKWADIAGARPPKGWDGKGEIFTHK